MPLLRLILPACALLALPAAGAPGDLDIAFGTGGKVITDIFGAWDIAESVVLQSDGKIVVGGYSDRVTDPTNYSDHNDFTLARYTSDGTLDASFGKGGIVSTDFNFRQDAGMHLAVQSDGKILLAGYSGTNAFSSDYALTRYTAAGLPDSAFGVDGRVLVGLLGSDTACAVKVLTDGKIVMAGSARASFEDSDFALSCRMNDGTPGTAFGANGATITPVTGDFNDYARDMLVQDDGKIVTAGYSLNSTGTRFALTRHLSNGSLDPGFGTNGIVMTDFVGDQDVGRCMAIQNDGKIIVAGSYKQGSAPNFALARYLESGTLDSSFGTGGMVLTPVGSSGEIYAIALQSDGKIVVAGGCWVGGYNHIALARYITSGALDPSFGVGGLATAGFGSLRSYCSGLAIQNDGKIVVAGTLYSSDGYIRDFIVARFEGDGPADNDTDGLLDQWEFNNWRTTAGHGPLDDHDKDGYCELLEQAFGLNPAFSNPGGNPSTTQEGGYLTMTLTKQPGVTYEVQTAGTLIPAQPDSFSAASTTILINDATTLKARDNVLISSGARRFIRAQVTAAPD